VPGGRERLVKLRLSVAEEAWLVPRAAALGISVQRLLVESAMAGGRESLLARRVMEGEFYVARRDLHGAATNLNQLARLGNERGEIPLGLGATIARVEAARDRLGALAEQITTRADGSDDDFGGACGPGSDGEP
jgi:hypothetical protein